MLLTSDGFNLEYQKLFNQNHSLKMPLQCFNNNFKSTTYEELQKVLTENKIMHKKMQQIYKLERNNGI